MAGSGNGSVQQTTKSPSSDILWHHLDVASMSNKVTRSFRFCILFVQYSLRCNLERWHNTIKNTTLYWNKRQNAISLQHLHKLVSLECIPQFSFPFFPSATHPPVFFSNFILSFPMLGLELIWIPDGIPLREWLEFYQDIDIATLRTHLVQLERCQMYPLSMIWARRIPISSEYSMRLLRDPWHPIWGWLMQCSFDSHHRVIVKVSGDIAILQGMIRDSLPTYQQCSLLPNSQSNCTNSSMWWWLLSIIHERTNEWFDQRFPTNLLIWF
jgi:hypothetical protein